MNQIDIDGIRAECAQLDEEHNGACNGCRWKEIWHEI